MEVDYRLLPSEIYDLDAHRKQIIRQHPELPLDFKFELIRRNIDARFTPVISMRLFRRIRMHT